MSGIRLLEMDPPDMLDVIHVLLEADYAELAPEQRAGRERVRRVIYNDIYKTRYRGYDDGVTPAPTSADGSPTGNAQVSTKPYIPPTNPEDLPRVLGAPLG